MRQIEELLLLFAVHHYIDLTSSPYRQRIHHYCISNVYEYWLYYVPVRIRVFTVRWCIFMDLLLNLSHSVCLSVCLYPSISLCLCLSVCTKTVTQKSWRIRQKFRSRKVAVSEAVILILSQSLTPTAVDNVCPSYVSSTAPGSRRYYRQLQALVENVFLLLFSAY